MKNAGFLRRSCCRGAWTAILMAFAAASHAQVPDTVSLFRCHRMAMETHPYQGQKELYERSRDLKVKNHTVNWLPSLELNGKYTWQNEVVQIPFAELVPGFDKPSMPHYNYKLTLDVQQTLYDGGISRKGKELEESVFEVNRQKVEVSLNRLKEQVNRTYFYILVLQQKERIMQLKQNELLERLSMMESHLRNETVLESDLNVIRAEILKVGQQLAEISIGKETALAALKELTSMDISEETVLEMPTSEMQTGTRPFLPEHVLYELQIRNLDAGMRLAERQRYPRAFVFGQLGYGNPALDFFRDEFRAYYIVGAGLQWRFWDWNRTRREKEVLAVQQDIIRTQQEAFDKTLCILLEELAADIVKYEDAVARDKEILRLRRDITIAAISKLENGVITPTEYVTELNAEIQARIQLDLHRIQLEQARIEYLTAKGII